MYTCIYVYMFVHYSTQKVINKYFWVHKFMCTWLCRKTKMKYSKMLIVVLTRQWNSGGCLFSFIFSKLPQWTCYFYILTILLQTFGLKKLIAIFAWVFQWCKHSVARYPPPCLVSSRIHSFGAIIIWIQTPGFPFRAVWLWSG